MLNTDCTIITLNFIIGNKKRYLIFFLYLLFILAHKLIYNFDFFVKKYNLYYLGLLHRCIFR